MTVVIKVPGVDWSNKGFPSIYPFVATEDLEYGFDFADRSGRFDDVSGNYMSLVPYRNDVKESILQQDDSVIFDVGGGEGMRIEMGFLDSDIPVVDIPLDGSVQFTTMVVGGYSGVPFPAEKIPDGSSAPGIASLIDYGTNVNNNGYALEFTASGARLGARIESFSPNLNQNGAKSGCLFLTFDGTNWTYKNPATGFALSKTNAELGLSGSVTASAASTYVTHGHFSRTPESVIHALFPTLYQSARWNRVLTAAEIAEQYNRTKSAKPLAGL